MAGQVLQLLACIEICIVQCRKAKVIILHVRNLCDHETRRHHNREQLGGNCNLSGVLHPDKIPSEEKVVQVHGKQDSL